jgi:uncharacterized protein YchJ
MSTCSCQNQDRYANCCRAKAAEAKVNVALSVIENVRQSVQRMDSDIAIVILRLLNELTGILK